MTAPTAAMSRDLNDREDETLAHPVLSPPEEAPVLAEPSAHEPVPEPASADLLEDIELAGERYAVSPALKLQIEDLAARAASAADLAQSRESLEEERAAFDGMLSGQAEIHALSAIDGVLAHFQALDWAGATARDPEWARAAWERYAGVLKAREGLTATLAARAEAAQRWERDSQGRAAKKALAELAAAVPGWSAETEKGLREFAKREFGFEADEVDQVTDARLLKLLHQAYAAKTTAERLARLRAAQATEPAIALRGGGGGAAISPATDDFAAFERFADARLAARPRTVRTIGSW